MTSLDLGSPIDAGHVHGRLILTKLRAPRAASDGVVRERLLREIDRGVRRKLTTVVTPPGFGKSTLASQWHARAAIPSAWLSLDDADNDVHLFLEYIVAAVRSIDPSMCTETASELLVGSQASSRQLVGLLTNELTEATRPFALVIDDYHVITSEEVRASFEQLLNLMPVMMSVVLTSRQQPDLPLLQMSAHGELVELGPDDLSFTIEEAREFLIERSGLHLSPAESDLIHGWSEGWPVAMRLVAGSLSQRPGEQVGTFLDHLPESVPALSTYLWDEVIEIQSANRRTFLLQTSILRQINPAVAEAVTGDSNAGGILESLSHDNLFISHLQGPGSWHRYHHLFADVLRQHLSREVPCEEVRRLHERAARWFDAHHFVSEAAHHAVQAHDWRLAARTLGTICEELYEQERVGTLHQWLNGLPDEVLRAEPRLAFWLAWAQIRTGRAQDARRTIAIAEMATASDDPQVLVIARQIQILKSLFAWDRESGEAAAAQLLESLDPDDAPNRSRAYIMLGMLRETAGALSESEDALETARELNGRLGIRGLRVAELAASGVLQLSMGKLREPADLFRRVITIGDEWNDLPLQNSHQKLGAIYYEWNQLDKARVEADRAEELATRMDAPLHLSQIPALRARIDMAEDKWDRAFDEIDRAISASENAGYSGVLRSFEETRSRMWLMAKQFVLARSWARRTEEDLIFPARYEDVSSILTMHRVLIQTGDARHSIEPLEDLRRCAIEQGWNRAVISIQSVRAIAEADLGNHDEALSALSEALRLAHPEGFVRTFLDEGPQLIPLLKAISHHHGHCQRYAASLLEVAGTANVSVASAPSRDPGILSPRERDVMRLVAAGLSNRDVGDALFISEETVKTHMRRIFEKLEVSSRTQAIHRASQLGIV